MRVGKKGIAALALMLVAVLTVGRLALAISGDGWVDGSDELGGLGSLTVTSTASAEVLSDLHEADVVIDVFLLARAEKNAMIDDYDLTLEEPYDTEEMAALLAAARDPQNVSDGGYEALAEAALPYATLHAEGSFAIDEGISGLDDGLYLVVPHSRGLTDAGATARSAHYEYSFSPGIVSIPTKDVPRDGALYTDYGNWIRDTTVTLKFERTQRLGSVRITKEVDEQPGEAATFVFHLVGTTPEGADFEEYAAVTLDGASSGETVVGHIPAGTEVSVEEVYRAGRYELVSGPKGTLTVPADDAVTAAFRNKESDGGVYGGHGIENHYEYDREGTKDWDWTATPGASASSRAQGGD